MFLMICDLTNLQKGSREYIYRIHLMLQFPGGFNVVTYASLGDSFASTPSVGGKYDTTGCRRYMQAFGPQLAASDEIPGP